VGAQDPGCVPDIWSDALSNVVFATNISNKDKITQESETQHTGEEMKR